MLAIDHYYYIPLTFTFLTASWWKMYSHIVEFLSAVFPHFNVTFYLEYHCTALSEVSRGKKWSVNPFQTLKVQKMEYTYSSTNCKNYEKKIWVIKEQNLHKFVLRWCSEMNIGETWSFSLPSTWLKISSTKKNCRKYFRQRSWFAFARSLFHKQRVYCQKSINIQLSFHLGHWATLYREGLKCQLEFA